MQSNLLSIKAVRSCKCGKANNEVIDASDSTIQHKNKLIHEHDFITSTIKETNNFLVNCIICGIYYCNLCGKAL
jgi:hypothetical protein